MVILEEETADRAIRSERFAVMTSRRYEEGAERAFKQWTSTTCPSMSQKRCERT